LKMQSNNVEIVTFIYSKWAADITGKLETDINFFFQKAYRFRNKGLHEMIILKYVFERIMCVLSLTGSVDG